jgi:hypothetical protein
MSWQEIVGMEDSLGYSGTTFEYVTAEKVGRGNAGFQTDEVDRCVHREPQQNR